MTASWFIQTRGEKPRQGYAWLTVQPGANPLEAAELVDGQVGGRRVSDYLSDQTPSLLLARLDDGSFLLIANRLQPPKAPSGGDHMGRPIHATVLGITRAGLESLLDVADAVVTERLAARLPLTWAGGEPAIDRTSPSWPDLDGATADRSGSDASPMSDMVRLRQKIAKLREVDPGTIERGQVLVLRTGDEVSVDQSAVAAPRRDSSTGVARSRDSKERKTVITPVLGVVVLLVALGVLGLVAWLLWRIAGGR